MEEGIKSNRERESNIEKGREKAKVFPRAEYRRFKNVKIVVYAELGSFTHGLQNIFHNNF